MIKLLFNITKIIYRRFQKRSPDYVMIKIQILTFKVIKY